MRHVIFASILVFPISLAADSGKLSPEEGEVLELPIGPWIIKASPDTGTQSAELHTLRAVPNFSTGLHEHLDADEFFYVISGAGKATIGETSVAIGPGDVLFIPKGTDHKVVNTSDAMPLDLLFFLDKPGLAQEAREVHALFEERGKDFEMTLDILNEIAERHGTVYKTLQ